MFKKFNLLKVIAFSSLTIISCTSVNEDSIKIDCSSSDLEITAINTTTATCSTGGSVEVVVAGGEGSFTYLIGTTEQNESSFSNLPAGTYSVEVTDRTGCSVTSNFEITGSDDTITATVEVTPSGCDENSGQIVISASGGDQDFTYSLNGGNFQAESTFSSLSAEEYSVTVRDGNGCLAELSVVVNTDISLANNIMPIIEANCAVSGCHKDARNPILVTKSAIIQFASRIAARTSSTTNPMPPSGALPQSEINDILCWVDSGALDN